MSPATVDTYLAELEAALHVRGRVRRRFLRECRDHLADGAAAHGEPTAVRVFGPPAEIAAAFDREVAARRGVSSTVAAVLGVLATGGSTLALTHAAAPDATAPTGWTITFFVAAQVAAVAAALALVQALVLRRATMPAPDLRLLARRNALALVAAGVTMFAAGAALPGRGSAELLLAGPSSSASRSSPCCARGRSRGGSTPWAGGRPARRSPTSNGSSPFPSRNSAPAGCSS